LGLSYEEKKQDKQGIHHIHGQAWVHHRYAIRGHLATHQTPNMMPTATSQHQTLPNPAQSLKENEKEAKDNPTTTENTVPSLQP